MMTTISGALLETGQADESEDAAELQAPNAAPIAEAGGLSARQALHLLLDRASEAASDEYTEDYTIDDVDEIDEVGARVSSAYEATGLIEPQALLLLLTRDAWLGAREILRRIALGDPNAVELARVYVALGFGGSSDDEDTVEFLHVDVSESLISSYEEEDDESHS